MPGRAWVGLAATAVLSTTLAPAALAAPSPTPPPGPPTPTPFPTSTVGGADLARPGVLVRVPPGRPAPPPLRADAYLVADLDDGRIILALNAHARMRPASTLKTLTALTVAPTLSPRRVVRAVREDAAIDGTKVGMVPGEDYTVHQLLQGLMMTSGNDAANALGRISGGVPATARRMTLKARSLGAMDTVAKNTSGLDATGQVTSAYDLALLGKAAVADRHVAPYLTTKTAPFPGRRSNGPRSKRLTFEIGNHNRLLWNYPGMIGVKNGYTKAAKQTYIGAARRGSKAYLVTYLGGNGVGWRDTAALLDWAFANGDQVGEVGRLAPPPSATPGRVAAAAPTTTPAVTQALDALTTDDAGRGRVALAGAAAAVLAVGAALVLRARRRS